MSPSRFSPPPGSPRKRQEARQVGYPRVQGYCPMCGRESLFLGQGGFVTCSTAECPAPGAVSDILSDRETEHVVTFRQSTFIVRHPLRERIGDDAVDCMENCRLQLEVEAMDGPPVRLGRYRARRGTDDRWIWEQLS